MYNWYLIYTKPRHEEKVTTRLADSGFEVFNPKLKERRYIRRKLQHVISPLFPCYVFVKFKVPDDHRFIKYTRGVRGIVGTENTPIPVSENILSSVRSRLEEGFAVIKGNEFKHGEKVVINAEPFKGLEAVFEREMKGVERVLVLLTVINAKVVLDSAVISKA